MSIRGTPVRFIFYEREGFEIQCESLDEATGEKDYTMAWRQEQR